MFVKAATIAALLAGKLLSVLGLLRQPDLWRRTVGLGLRSDASKFVLSAFGLRRDATSEEKFARELGTFLATDPEACAALEHRQHFVERVKSPNVDVTLARFSTTGELESIRPQLDARAPLVPEELRLLEVERVIVEQYNSTRHLPEGVRPRALTRAVESALIGLTADEKLRTLALEYSQRILKSSTVSFESVGAEAGARFDPPDFRTRRALGLGFLNFVCRRMPHGTADLWMQVHHTGADGVPMQELLGRLEKAWGIDPTVTFPSPSLAQREPKPCYTSAGERPVHLATAFLDFTPLVTLRRALNERFAAAAGGNVPLPCVLLWGLARQPEFDGVKFSVTVDVAAMGSSGRGVDLIVIRPKDYAPGADGFADYARDFNQRVVEARARRSVASDTMRTVCLLPPLLASKALTDDPATFRKAFGTVAISIIKDAKVFVAPMADGGFEAGFIAIGSISLPGEGGGAVGSVTIKGDPKIIQHYPAALRRAANTSLEQFL